VYDPTAYFPPVVKSSSFSSLLDPVEPWISQWRGIRNEICSPFQRLYIRDWDAFYNLITYAQSDRHDLRKLDLTLGKNYTLYRLAMNLRMSIQELAVLLHPLIKAGAIGVRPYQDITHRHRPLIASLNQRRFDQQLTQRTLERSGFDVLMLQSPSRVVGQLVKTKPAVALLDSNLSQINGVEMCRNIRRYRSLRNIPIILLMREPHFMGEARSQWAGANDVLTNPIKPQDLVKCVNHWQQTAG
ncbi:MAG: response regulator, partial [Cyanobacteria bacterium P01_F01_bin.42]